LVSHRGKAKVMPGGTDLLV